jgi:hypothetical protein
MWEQVRLRVDQLILGPPNRPVSEASCRKMIAKWDPDGVGALYVNQRSDGTFHVVDGGHRVTCFLLLGESDAYVNVELARGLTFAEEAAKAAVLNNRRGTNSVARLARDADAGDPNAIFILAVLTSKGYILSTSGAKRCVRCAVALREVSALGTLDDTFDVIEAAWGDEAGAHDDPVVRGVGRVLADFPHIDKARLARKARDRFPTPRVLIGEATFAGAYSSKHRRTPELLLDAYNRNLKTHRLEYRRAGSLEEVKKDG